MALNTKMQDFPESYNSHCQSSTVKRIGQDMRGIVDYKFNSQGFRADVDYRVDETQAIAYFGNLYTSAVGINWKHGYPSLTSEQIGSKAYNFSQGCAGVDNNEIVRTVKHVAEMHGFEPMFYVIQFCELERRFSRKTQGLTLNMDKVKNVDNFVMLFDELQRILAGKQWLFFGIDHTLNHDIPQDILEHDNCLCWNPSMIDKILQGIAGEKWHAMMAYGLSKRIENAIGLA